MTDYKKKLSDKITTVVNYAKNKNLSPNYKIVIDNANIVSKSSTSNLVSISNELSNLENLHKLIHNINKIPVSEISENTNDMFDKLNTETQNVLMSGGNLDSLYKESLSEKIILSEKNLDINSKIQILKSNIAKLNEDIYNNENLDKTSQKKINLLEIKLQELKNKKFQEINNLKLKVNNFENQLQNLKKEGGSDSIKKSNQLLCDTKIKKINDENENIINYLKKIHKDEMEYLENSVKEKVLYIENELPSDSMPIKKRITTTFALKMNNIDNQIKKKISESNLKKNREISKIKSQISEKTNDENLKLLNKTKNINSGLDSTKSSLINKTNDLTDEQDINFKIDILKKTNKECETNKIQLNNLLNSYTEKLKIKNANLIECEKKIQSCNEKCRNYKIEVKENNINKSTCNESLNILQEKNRDLSSKLTNLQKSLSHIKEPVIEGGSEFIINYKYCILIICIMVLLFIIYLLFYFPETKNHITFDECNNYK
jgi:chromosome segregation ATPase